MPELSDPTEWVDKYGDALYRYAMLRLKGDAALAEDLVQEALLAALQARQRFAGQSSEKTWLISILKHKILDYFRKAGRELQSEDIEAVAAQQDRQFDGRGHWQITLSSWDNPDQSLEQQAFQQILADCISYLPERMADALILREFQEMDNDSLCKALDISTTNNLWVMLSRARMRLRDCLDKNWFSAS